MIVLWSVRIFFFFQAEDGIRDVAVTGVQTCALPISGGLGARRLPGGDRRTHPDAEATARRGRTADGRHPGVTARELWALAPHARRHREPVGTGGLALGGTRRGGRGLSVERDERGSRLARRLTR